MEEVIDLATIQKEEIEGGMTHLRAA